MRVKISQQANISPPNVYELSAQELERLLDDYFQYRQAGTPRTGIYTIYADAEHKQTKHIFLTFSTIAAIE